MSIRYRVFVDVCCSGLSSNNFLIENFYCDTLSEAKRCADEWKKTIPTAVVTISEESSECVSVL